MKLPKKVERGRWGIYFLGKFFTARVKLNNKISWWGSKVLK